MTTCLLVEDDENVGFGIRAALGRRGLEVHVAPSAEAAYAAVDRLVYDVILLDLGLPDADGFDVLASLREREPASAVIVLTGRDDAPSAVRALHAGAADFLTKPVPSDALAVAISRAVERASLKKSLELARRQATRPHAAVGASPAWRRALATIEAAAASARTPVLLTGASGTGKELAASLVHAWSPRADGPFVSVNAACFPPALLESELFGHEAGAFTDARGGRRGLFELASGGTLFLDEVAELPRELQAKLLRVLEGHPFRRVGGEREVRVDVRVVSATNRRLADEVAADRFRLDLFHRLRVVEVELPSLADRGDDVLALALHFVARLGPELGKPDAVLSPAALASLRAYRWPGNVRELRNVVERALVLSRGPEILPADLPPEVARAAPAAAAPLPRPEAVPPAEVEPLRVHVRRHVVAAFERANGNLSRAAVLLGISRVTLRKQLREYGLEPRKV